MGTWFRDQTQVQYTQKVGLRYICDEHRLHRAIGLSVEFESATLAIYVLRILRAD